MRIFEIDRQSRKTVKKLTNLYIEYIMDGNKHNDLVEFMNMYGQTTDEDLLREIGIISEKLQENLIRLLSK